MEITPGPVELGDMSSKSSGSPIHVAPVFEGARKDNEYVVKPPVDIFIRNLSVEVQRPKASKTKAAKNKNADVPASEKASNASKSILRNVSAHLPGSGLTAIIGSSGSGKTSLLNVMSCRTGTSRLVQTGDVVFSTDSDNVTEGNGQKICTAYVMQQDILLPTLTVRETLQYAADLRHAVTMPKVERLAMVNKVIADLQLTSCADTRIGNSVHRGCSGGQKRRTSIGVQLLADPSVLFLDEPTTGLDASSALQVISTLKHLAESGRTIVMTIHQPRSEIWSLLDSIILLSHGTPLYAGPVDGCLSYFERQGHSLPPFVNPFDFVIDLAAVDIRSEDLERLSLIRVTALRQAWKAVSTSAAENAKTNGGNTNSVIQTSGTKHNLRSYLSETFVHARRTFVVTCRDRLGLAASLIEALGMGIISGLIFYKMGRDLSGIRSREGAAYSATALQSYLVLLFETYRLTVDIGLFDRERVEDVARPITFVLSRRLARFPLEDVAVPLLYSITFYFMAGFEQTADRFLVFLGIQLLLHFIAVNVAMVCVAISRQFMTASLVGNLIFTIQSMGSGFFVNAKDMPIWLGWVRWTAYVFYAFGATCTNEFANNFYDCPSAGGASNPACKEYTGSYILQSLGLPSDWLVRPIIVLLGFVLFAFFLSVAILQFLPSKIEMAKARKSSSDVPPGPPQLISGEGKPITVSLEHFALGVERKSMFRKKLSKQIFQPITASFEPGVLNAIMGPSGSGKSSCLNAIARRLHVNSQTKYISSGQVLFNGSAASDKVASAIVSYVPQDDSGLLRCLTVRETLHFAARLRLPTWMTVEQKIKRAEEVLLSLGLRDCADTLIGSDLVKGISGGEKRRVTIATQILTNPRVLLLDEPTSGLDAFTAMSIIEVLKVLADEGRTIIFVIHQPRSDLFQQFGSVLLLSNTGEAVYSGIPSGMISHFESQGFEYPEATNPADFALDIVSADRPASSEHVPSLNTANPPLLAGVSPTTDQTPTSTDKTLAAPAALGSYERSMIPWHAAIPLLAHRSLINLRRQPELLAGRVSQLAGLAIVLVAFFTPLHNNYYSVQTRMGYVQQIGSVFFVGMLNSIAMYVQERDIFYQEHEDLAYSVESFFFSYTLLEIPMGLFAAFIFSALTVFAVGLGDRSAGMYFLMVYSSFCVVACGESFGILFFTLFSHTGLAVSVMSVVLSVAVSLGGVLSISVMQWLQAINHISPVKWLIGALASYSMRGVTFTCTEAQRLSDGSCPYTSGEQVLRLYKLDVSTGEYALALGGVALGYRVLAYCGLKVKMMGLGKRRRRG